MKSSPVMESMFDLLCSHFSSPCTRYSSHPPCAPWFTSSFAIFFVVSCAQLIMVTQPWQHVSSFVHELTLKWYIDVQETFTGQVSNHFWTPKLWALCGKRATSHIQFFLKLKTWHFYVVSITWVLTEYWSTEAKEQNKCDCPNTSSLDCIYDILYAGVPTEYFRGGKVNCACSYRHILIRALPAYLTLIHQIMMWKYFFKKHIFFFHSELCFWTKLVKKISWFEVM